MGEVHWEGSMAARFSLLEAFEYSTDKNMFFLYSVLRTRRKK